MTSTATPLGFNKQGNGDNSNTWGAILNTEVFDLIDEAIRGRAAFVLTGTVTLDATNYVSNQARCALLHATSGTGGTVVIPAISKMYIAWNQSTGTMVVSTGGATTTTLEAGDLTVIFCDGGKVRQLMVGGASIKDYVDNLAWTYNAGALPAQAGNADKYISTDGATAGWRAFAATAAQIMAAATSLAAITPAGWKAALVPYALTDAATVTPDGLLGLLFTWTIGGNRTLGAITNTYVGASYRIKVTQDGTGSRILAVASAYDRVGGLAVLSTAAGAVDYILIDVWAVDGSGTATLAVYDVLRAPS